MLSLFVRNLIFTILQPGVAVVLVPYLIIRGTADTIDGRSAWQYSGVVLMAVGAAVLLLCIIRFATEGRGTISPLDPTRRLVIRGLYRYTRNPMYLGAIVALVGETIFWWSTAMAIYTAIVFAAFHLFILLHEEPRLERDFGAEYDDYRSTVRRWI